MNILIAEYILTSSKFLSRFLPQGAICDAAVYGMTAKEKQVKSQ